MIHVHGTDSFTCPPEVLFFEILVSTYGPGPYGPEPYAPGPYGEENSKLKMLQDHIWKKKKKKKKHCSRSKANMLLE